MPVWQVSVPQQSALPVQLAPDPWQEPFSQWPLLQVIAPQQSAAVLQTA